MITNHDTAKLVSETLRRFRADMREVQPSVEQSCSPEDFRAYSNALRRAFHCLYDDILYRIYCTHPDLRPKDWPMLGEKMPQSEP